MKKCCKDGNNWITIEDKGCLVLYKCKICGEENWIHVDYSLDYYLGYDTSQALPERCRIYVEWSREIGIVSQINILKNLFPHLRKVGNLKLLKLARTREKWLIDEMYVSEAEKLIKLAEAQKMVLSIEKL